MKKKLREVSESGIYQNKSVVKVGIVLISVFIGGLSIFTTNIIVNELKEREQRMISLYANTLEYITNNENSENLIFIFDEIVVRNNSIPVIVTNAFGKPDLETHRNITFPKNATDADKEQVLLKELEVMRAEHPPIEIVLEDEEGNPTDYSYVYYRNSDLLYRLTYYPYVQLSIIAVFGFLVYVAFSYSKAAEQNRVWAGLAKETAHQLGTPLSSLIAWTEYLGTIPEVKSKGILEELQKDIHRLNMITERFSNIGSVPVLVDENLKEVVVGLVTYLKPRISSRVSISTSQLNEQITAKINKPLFEWVIENICKNAIDAMENGTGTIQIQAMIVKGGKVALDITDTGKGMTKKQAAQIFNPGFTTKKRGWGLGLTLTKRIVENYHDGKIFVKATEINKGTTFRIILNR
ncbi:MAG: HAMP domain-containing histidine kinase [Cyclobacteriaceae bacterium]|nr:HAMP domain-containing histidine kinase [Cyclobacteriaceae bacterium]MCH8516819.1 HAMP domain-containing histidine kinase [Cyclobacteriaceae bacterium]